MIGIRNQPVAGAASGPERSPRAPARWLGRICLLTLALAALGLIGGYVAFSSSIALREPAAVPRTDAIVVVTGGSQRVGDALGLLGAERGARLLISGVNERTGREELARLNPAARDLLSCCIDLDHRARNTIGNAIETRRWVRQHGFSSLLVVTSNYHMPRTLAEFGHAMPGMRLVPHPVVTESVDLADWRSHWQAARLLIPEYVKYLAARLRALVEDDPETSRLSVIIGGRKPVSPKPLGLIGPEQERRSHLGLSAKGA
ncbi:MAG: YdcF family protein [Bosea sp. (in: a-proteobacteria)]